MSEAWEYIVIGLLVAVAGGLVLWRVVRAVRGRGGCTSCAGCPGRDGQSCRLGGDSDKDATTSQTDS